MVKDALEIFNRLSNPFELENNEAVAEKFCFHVLSECTHSRNTRTSFQHFEQKLLRHLHEEAS